MAQRLARAAVPEGGVRLIGVSLGGLTDAPPPTLFGLGLGLPPASRPVGDAPPDVGIPPDSGSSMDLDTPPASDTRPWHPGDDVRHAEHGHGWVQGAGHGRVTVRFETRTTARAERAPWPPTTPTSPGPTPWPAWPDPTGARPTSRCRLGTGRGHGEPPAHRPSPAPCANGTLGQ